MICWSKARELHRTAPQRSAKAKQRKERSRKGMAKKGDALQWYGIALMCEGKAVNGKTTLSRAEADRKKG